MKTTIFLALLSMVALFLLLYAAVALIQDRRFFTTAPKDIQEAIQEHEERFPYQRILGWKLAFIALLMFCFVFIYAGYDGIQNGYGFGRFFIRYLTILCRAVSTIRQKRRCVKRVSTKSHVCRKRTLAEMPRVFLIFSTMVLQWKEHWIFASRIMPR